MKKVSLLSFFLITLFVSNGFTQLKSDIRRQSDSHRTVVEYYENLIKELYAVPGNLKSGQAGETFKMDSIVNMILDTITGRYTLLGKQWFAYDSIGRNTMESELASETGVIFPEFGYRVEYTYDAAGYVSNAINFDWADQQGFYPSFSQDREYDGFGRPVRITSRIWDQIGQGWIPYTVDSLQYNVPGNLLKTSTYQYDTVSMSWMGLYRVNYTLDSLGFKDFSISQFFDPDSAFFVNQGRSDFFTDAQGRDTTIINYYWNFGNWVESGMQKASYNSNGVLTMFEYSNFDGEIYYGTQKEEFVLDGNDNVQERLFYAWDWFWFDWYLEGKNVNERDGNQNLVTETRFLYDTMAKVFVEDWQDQYFHDLSVSFDEIALPPSIQAEINDNYNIHVNKMDRAIYLEYNIPGQTWDTSEVEFIYYSDLSTPAQPLECAADFTFRVGQSPEEIVFTDGSGANAAKWYWTFGDGATSTQRNPVHVYRLPGTYKVTLSVTNSAGDCSNTTVQQIKVGNLACNAEFSMAIDTVLGVVSFDNTSAGTGLSYYWSFGDGEVSKDVNPLHTYSYPGTYDITLTVQSADGACMDRYTMSARVGTVVCRADFDVFVDSFNNSVKFRARAQNPENLYRWEFGDGRIRTTPNVELSFPNPGHYSARLTVSNATAGCVNSTKAEVLVGKPSPGGKAGFIYLSGNANKVQFSDRSLGEDLKYFWDFNDGNNSKDPDPMHEYALAGYYNVCLTVQDADGNRNTYCEKIFAGEETKDQCLALFEYRLTPNQRGIACLDRSLGNPDSWKWIYDDGWSTTVQNPSWSTVTPSYVKIQQTIQNSLNGCRDDAFALVNMGAEQKLVAGFGVLIREDNKKADTYPVDLVGVSLGDAGKLKWDFGDGTTDTTSINPTHVYLQPGVYTVCLTLTNTTTGEEDTSCETITVGPVSTFDKLNDLKIGVLSYPNPASNYARIEILLASDTEMDLSLYDHTGRMVQNIARESRLAGTHSFDYNTANLEAGNYYLVLTTEDGVARSIMSVVR